MVAVSESALSIPAFPGALGFGADSTGGRGGDVIKVTNLNDSGAGSFRAAVEATGARIVVFETSGIINLQSDLSITNPNLTIAGETSPGGILITGYPTRFSTSDVIVRHIRFRVGSHQITSNGGNSDAEQHDAVQVWGSSSREVSDIIFDHVSVGWGIDENFEFAYNPKNVTVQNSIISEGLTNAGHPKGSHGKGMLVWNKYSPDTRITIYNNFFGHNQDRNPEINTPANGTTIRAEVVNNIAFNWFGGIVMTSYTTTPINYIGNYARKGPSSNASAWEALHYASSGYTPGPYVYMNGNRGLNDDVSGVTEWRIAAGWRYSLQDEIWRRSTPWDMSTTPMVATVPSSAGWANEMVTSVGATVPVRDHVDQRVVDDFLASETSPQGSYLADVAYPADFPSFTDTPAPTDGDNDGMADSWETVNGMNTSANDSAADDDGDGYTNIEEYLHFLAAGSVGISLAIPPPNFKGSVK